MSTSAIVMAIFSCVLLWGGFGLCLKIAFKK